MAIIAKGMITLSTLNDAYNVSLSPNSCVINADFDGTNHKLDTAYTNITITRGDMPVEFDIKLYSTSNQAIKYDIISVDIYTKRIKLTGLPTDILSGFLEFEVKSAKDFSATATFQFTVVRESTMLDWIQDWENNKTTIGSTYMITPKIFVGKKITTSEDMKALTGVYIGPDSDNGAGIYGYKEGEDIFHINERGGLIGGWEINKGGIQTADGYLKILSEGSIIASDKDANVIWGIYKSGEATFANGNVLFHADGSAYFNGKINAKSGNIAGWSILEGQINNGNVVVSSKEKAIGICTQAFIINEFTKEISITGSVTRGGVMMYYNSSSDFGFVGYKNGLLNAGKKVISIGSTNLIAGWNFDNEAIWIGTKLNLARNYTSGDASITIGTNGLRGQGWYIDSDGSISFVKGLVAFNTEGGEISGWKITTHRLSTAHVAIISESNYAGIYLTSQNISDTASSSLADKIIESGGIYLTSNEINSVLMAYNCSGELMFRLSTADNNYIAGWNFSKQEISFGTAVHTGFASEGSITIATDGIRGHGWRLEADGSGAIGGGNIAWDKKGDVTLGDRVTLTWGQITNTDQVTNKLTKIDANGVYTGTIDAIQITAGTIDASLINADIILANGDAWAFMKDGSGYLANKNINWSKNGDLNITGILKSELYYGSVKQLDKNLELYEINPELEPYNWYVLNEPTQRNYIVLPPALLYDGLELSFFICNSNWTYGVNSTHIKAYTGDVLYIKKNIYGLEWEGPVGTSKVIVENFRSIYEGLSSYCMMQINMVVKFKSMLGSWWCIQGLWTGE